MTRMPIFLGCSRRCERSHEIARAGHAAAARVVSAQDAGKGYEAVVDVQASFPAHGKAAELVQPG
jgi:hypothetical protein